MSQSTKISLSMLLGVVVGFIFNLYIPENTIQFLDKNIFHLIGTGFIRFIQFIVVPIILASLVVSMTRMKDIKKNRSI
ncbi:cation:dicarboxylate symporter family transporter [Tepidibacillus fermentans]|uniref:Sodium:dicarboxylate symporter family protein n=1 Tax=Tepidibacillus fermentans TaxID=1281767 RepID=A0A4R3KIX4_9BACI|nr:cation:dicarboxylase symporter family transporter [Tepidibacillus fermentans]TCS83050.1 sodium:dicarboxylate symporter family protein [Tepidibacillus fermentans]